MKIGVAGGGAFGTALGVALALDGNDITLWARNPASVQVMRDDRINPKLPGVTLPQNMVCTADTDVLFAADIILLAIPAQTLHAFLQGHIAQLAGKHLVACCKGIDLTRMTGPATTIAALAPDATAAVLTGPSFAADISRGLPTALTLACADDAMGEMLQVALSTSALRLYRSTDTVGAELGGALKNVMAIAAGVTIGAGLGDSARAALMTRGFPEMQRLAMALGAVPETLLGLSGFGDLVLTCTSDQSRNYRYGLALGRGQSFDGATTVEGAATAQAVRKLARDMDIDLPICTVVADLVDGKTDVAAALNALLSRPLKEE
ncbi:NAD(P)H-dependent glycerol-3-phosphate dehydrogenase [Yoonia sediminilitoris]|uniref:Glycerol-3-phosphate dehydrogenase [NAD(P)+] n=1 Tax=Yoonia sediminilitoris TaxID=1286148 RepID=A0A2T6KAG0_9RHOB|nr:NAD(P)H-dependent glycerol-3-phosphate dehydrogenase [Yoonia sediminilitoris]PUB11762.1 glycerol-3-phosphate dehydrogenase (NAD(P)+) [Yoonia sediminilitoris]RCW91839.1 glycerol-3-phosphate dehydrogenase (NAD(P)+) [Yoonia sediminilitoris]